MSAAVRLDRIKPSPTVAVTSLARELKAQGKDVIGLGAGEPDFDTPEHIKQAAIAAMNAGQTKYTAVDGTPELKSAIAAKFKRDNDLTYSPAEISVGCGGKHVIFNAMMASVNPGDEVIIPAPFWVSYPDMVLMAEGVPVVLEARAEDGLKLTPERLEAAITPRTRWVILNSPSNPTGVAYRPEEILALAEVLRRHPHVLILSDDLYEHLIYAEDLPFRTIAALAPDLYDRVLTVNGLSKAYAMTGWRIGFAGGPKWLIQAMGDIQGHSTTNPCSISQAAGVAALNGSHAFLTGWKESFRRRRDLVVQGLNQCFGITCMEPEGAFYVFPDARALIGRRTPSGKTLETDQDLVGWLLQEHLVAVVQGSAFGAPGFFRISYATGEDALTKAVDRIRAATAELA